MPFKEETKLISFFTLQLQKDNFYIFKCTGTSLYCYSRCDSNVYMKRKIVDLTHWLIRKMRFCRSASEIIIKDMGKIDLYLKWYEKGLLCDYNSVSNVVILSKSLWHFCETFGKSQRPWISCKPFISRSLKCSFYVWSFSHIWRTCLFFSYIWDGEALIQMEWNRTTYNRNDCIEVLSQTPPCFHWI